MDSKVVHETDTEGAKSDESSWMRFTLDTVGKTDCRAAVKGVQYIRKGLKNWQETWTPASPAGQGRALYCKRCMFTEGWDCNTVTHIVGLRPFMSQLLCEQVVGRGLRRSNYEVGGKRHVFWKR